jgi:hypothetical protein
MAFFAIAVILSWFLPARTTAQEEEVLLSFKYPGIGYVYINSIYNPGTNTTYLPITELFSLMEIGQNPNPSGFSVNGIFLTNGEPYSINLTSRKITVGKVSKQISPDDFRIRETEYFLRPALFEELFGLRFTVDIMHLTLSLETTHLLPVQERKAREKARKKMDSGNQETSFYPLQYGRKRKFFSGMMADYTINGYYTPEESPAFGYTLSGGAELFGGDVSGTVIGLINTEGSSDFAFSSLRWRYAILSNPYISGVSAGDMVTTGLQPVSFRGISVTNDPIEPRRLFENYVVDGYTEPQSEVELYVNERITDFQRANELGYYRFTIPVNYGSTRISTRIYTPSGKVISNDKQMQVPFNFLPPGTVTYNLQAGTTDLGTTETINSQWIGQGNMVAGITSWLSASAGAQHLGNQFDYQNLFWYGNISARIAKQYLASLDIAPGFYNRLTATVLYPNNMSVAFTCTKFGSNELYNSRGAREEITGNVYFPFSLFGLQSGFRVGGEYLNLSLNSLTRYRAELSTRLGRFYLRFNYRDNLLVTGEEKLFGEGVLTTSVIYNISRSPGVPVFIQGMFLRGQTSFDIRRKLMQTSEIQFSKTILKKGRINFTGGYNHLTSSVYGQIGVTVDLKNLRSATQAGYGNEQLYFQQNFTGSIGWDMPNHRINLSNRQQVGRSAVSVRQFIDKNSNGKYDREDELLPNKGIKLDQSSLMQIGKDSILRITQIQSYYRYNVQVNRNAIADPTLIPLKDEFSFIADPNQYKMLEIPYYRGGTAEGKVILKKNGTGVGQGGLRVMIINTESHYQQVVRTFHDGSFYAMELPPGNYTLFADTIQVGFLKAQQKEPVHFTIRSLASGDMAEGLSVLLEDLIMATPIDEPEDSGVTLPETPEPGKYEPLQQKPLNEESENQNTTKDGQHEGTTSLAIQLGAFSQITNAKTLSNKISAFIVLPVLIRQENGLYKVRIESIKDENELERVRASLSEHGYKEIRVLRTDSD